MDEEILNRNRGDDDLPPGQADHMGDNRPQQELFFEVEGHHREQGDELAFSKSENCGQAIEDLKGAIKRADAVSPQVADVVDKVMSHSLLNHHQEWKNKNYEETPNPQPETLNEKNTHDVNCDSENCIPSHYQTTRVDGNKEIDNGDDWRRWQQENHLKRDEEKTFSDEGYDKNDYDGQKDSEKNGKVYDDEEDDDDDRENEWNEKYNNSNLNSSFQDDDSNLSSSPFGGSHGNQSAYSHNSYDPVRAPIAPNKEGVYFCHLCSFSGSSQLEFEDHMTCHFEHSCPHCDYKSRTEGRLKRHIKDFHTEDPPDGFGNKRNMGRPKVFRCKQCDFVATEKEEFWAHSRSHIKEDKILQCPRCPFVTEYKHHLEYHLRNHFGSKPFKCNKCNYSCVNKSMLNSHMKSHTNVYQYRCADCTYATKYCHSLKLHLRKYNHKPATVLNSDGSLPQGIDAEASGLSLMQKRGPPRGPRGPRKDKFDPFVGHLLSMPHPGMPGMPTGLNGGMMSPYWPILSQFPNGIQGPPPPLVPVSAGGNLHPQDMHQQRIPGMNSSPNIQKAGGNQTNDTPYKCNFCSFASDVKHDLLKHVMKVHAAENQDLFSIFGISSEALLEEQGRRMPYMGHKIMPKIGDVMGSPPKLPSSKVDDVNSPLPLKVKTEPNSSAKTSPHSWPHESSSEPLTPKSSRFEGSSGRYSMPELAYNNYRNDGSNTKNSESPAGDDIIKQMMFKFGSGMPAPTPRTPRESAPLDLTKRRSPSMSPLPEQYPHAFEARMPEHQNDENVSSGGEGESSVGGEVSHSPRKRSRKGKAFKLDTLCMKLQEKQTDSPYDSNDEAFSGSDDVDEEQKDDVEDSAGKDMADVEQREENVKDDDETKEMKSESNDDVLRQIQNDLAILNRGEYRPEDDIGREPDAKKRRTESSDQDGNEPHLTGSDDNAVKEKHISTPPMEENTSKTPDVRNGFNPAYYMNGNKSISNEIQRRRELEMTWKMLNSIGTQGTHPQLHPRFTPHNGFGLPMMHDKSPIKQQNLTGYLPSPLTSTPNGKNGIPMGKDKYECMYCEIAFRDCVMYTMHMGYHGYRDPFKCNMCGHTSKDKVEFFLHIARAAHN